MSNDTRVKNFRRSQEVYEHVLNRFSGCHAHPGTDAARRAAFEGAAASLPHTHKTAAMYYSKEMTNDFSNAQKRTVKKRRVEEGSGTASSAAVEEESGTASPAAPAADNALPAAPPLPHPHRDDF